MVAMKNLDLPLSVEAALTLKAGDIVSLNGVLATGRDRLHKFLSEDQPLPGELPFDPGGTVLYHCGPVVKKDDGGFRVLSAGPTTSMRVEMYEAFVIRRYGLRGIMGKGGMGEKTLQALKEHSCVYLQTIGGAAVYLADRIVNVRGVWKLDEFGPTEAMWIFEVKDFPAVVTMDAHGNNLHKEIERASFREFSGPAR
jgi:fumarate hydratase class I